MLYHECGHLVDCQVFLERNCDSLLKWKVDFLRTLGREFSLMTLLFNQIQQESEPLLELKTFDNCQHRTEEITRTVSSLHTESKILIELVIKWSVKITFFMSGALGNPTNVEKDMPVH